MGLSIVSACIRLGVVTSQIWALSDRRQEWKKEVWSVCSTTHQDAGHRQRQLHRGQRRLGWRHEGSRSVGGVTVVYLIHRGVKECPETHQSASGINVVVGFAKHGEQNRIQHFGLVMRCREFISRARPVPGGELRLIWDDLSLVLGCHVIPQDYSGAAAGEGKMLCGSDRCLVGHFA